MHGEFMQEPVRHIQGEGCSTCGYITFGLKLKKTTKQFIDESIKIHGDKYDYSKVIYKTSVDKVIIICKMHGEFEQTPDNHLRGNGCIKCQYLNQGLKSRKSTDDFIKKAKEIHGNKYDYSEVEYITCMKKVVIICKEHGKFEQVPNSHSRGNGCPRCNCSNQYSKSQIEWLEFISKYYNIYIQHAVNNEEYKIPNTNLKADGYCKETNTVYEYHGDYWHGNPLIFNQKDKSFFGKTYGELYENTLKREQKIKELGYNLVVMWENDWIKINKSIKKIQNKFRNSYYNIKKLI
jgi:hypothetical protein